MLTYKDITEQGLTLSKAEATLLQAKITPIAIHGHPESNEVFPAAVDMSKVEPIEPTKGKKGAGK